MKRIAVVLSLLLAIFAVSVQTQNQAPTPPPEMKALEMFNGDWTYEGVANETPLGPAGKISGKMTIRWILNGFFQEYKNVEKGNMGDIEIIEIDWYDTAAKKYCFQGFINNGDSFSGSQIMNRNVCNWSHINTHNGIQYHCKGVIIFTDDGLSFNNKSGISTDGKTWKPWFEIKNTKVKPAK